MAITPQSYLVNPQYQEPVAAIEAAKAYVRPGYLDAFTEQYIEELYEFCHATGLRFAIAFAQWCDETDRGASKLWNTKRNPAGIGALPDGTYVGITYTQPDHSAGAQCVHLWLYADGPTLPAVLVPYKQYDPRWNAAQGNAGKGARLSGLANTWATNPNYAVQISNHANAAFGSGIAEGATRASGEDNSVSFTTTIPGLPGGPITTSFPIKVRIVPANLTRVRPGIFASPVRRSIQHETANPNSFAAGEAAYLNGGAEGRTVSYHGAVDDTELWVMIPLNEVAWQAGDGSGPGNYKGFALELCVPTVIVNNTARRQKSQAMAAEFMGIVGARLEATMGPQQHAAYMQKNCPANLRARPAEWERYKTIWHQHYEAERARMAGGGGSTPVPTFPTKAVATTEVRQPLHLRTGPGTEYASLAVMPTGTKVDAYSMDHVNGWYPLGYGNLRGYAYGDYLAPLVPLPVDVPAPTYAEPIPIAALEVEWRKLLADAEAAGKDPNEYRYNHMSAVVTDEGMRFVTVWDLVEATQDTPRLQQGDAAGPVLGKPILKGERFVVGWQFVSQAGKLFYLTPPVYDDDGSLMWGWTRVQVEHTTRIADAPMPGGDTQPPD